MLLQLGLLGQHVQCSGQQPCGGLVTGDEQERGDPHHFDHVRQPTVRKALRRQFGEDVRMSGVGGGLASYVPAKV